jgi:hypothetical protein
LGFETVYLRESQMFQQLLLLISCMVCSSPLRMEAVWSFKSVWHLLLFLLAQKVEVICALKCQVFTQ